MNMDITPVTSSDGSGELGSSLTMDDDDGSDCDGRDYGDELHPVFQIGDDEPPRFSSPKGFHRDLEGQKIRVGICAMAKKAKSKPMKEILGRLERFEHLQLQVFDEEMVTKVPVEDWPVVDALVAFFSSGFPLQKAIQYKNLHNPYVINDLEAQFYLKDRREVYKILVREGIAHPRYAVFNRDDNGQEHLEEVEDAVEVNGTTFQRPFVEKPVNAEDHNIYIYFPTSAGGGCQRLFRKVGSRSSVYSTISRVRKSGSFIYEDFMPTDGTDVKVYTVGPDYAHAEARKSPALDGKVERDRYGKEVRYPVILSSMEKLIARKVCLAFKQNVCGFDLLRTGGKSYVCDVNGFSFVKNSTKYYDDCANVLRTMIVRALAPQLHIQNVALVLGAAPEDIPVVPTTSGSMMELRCVIAVIRHGDRTPKQKMKMEVKHRKFFELFDKYNGYKKGHLKLKKPKQLQEVLDIARELLSEDHYDINPEVQEKKAKLQQLKLVLEMYGHFSGINRKVQLKYQPLGASKRSSSEEDECPKEPSLVLIVKWGGELTPAGKYQAEDLGKAFRTLYPGGQDEFETPGLGFLRLHSTFRHDLKIYASDEGRVQMTAAAFTKGLLALEGELTPILVSMVKSANTNGLLDKEGETSKYQHIVKENLMSMLNQEQDFSEEDIERLCPTRCISLLKAMAFVKNPKGMCDRVYQMVQEITAKIRLLKLEKSRELKLYYGESWELLTRRWAKLEKDFKLRTGCYDISKIPDIYDCIKYDLQHNQKTLQFERAEELFTCSKALADIVIPQEYGITLEEKLHIAQSICTPLMRKIHCDIHQVCTGSDDESTRLNSQYSKGVASPERFVRTRLYFTSESHIHSLLNMLRYGGLCDESKDDQWKKAMDFLSNTPELNYMTQINIMMFEDPSKEETSPERFHVELHFSPGAYTCSDKCVVHPSSSGYRTSYIVRQGKKRESTLKHLDLIVPSHKLSGSPAMLKDAIEEDEEIVADEPTNVESLNSQSIDKDIILGIERNIDVAERIDLSVTNVVDDGEDNYSNELQVNKENTEDLDCSSDDTLVSTSTSINNPVCNTNVLTFSVNNAGVSDNNKMMVDNSECVPKDDSFINNTSRVRVLNDNSLINKTNIGHTFIQGLDNFDDHLTEIQDNSANLTVTSLVNSEVINMSHYAVKPFREPSIESDNSDVRSIENDAHNIDFRVHALSKLPQVSNHYSLQNKSSQCDLSKRSVSEEINIVVGGDMDIDDHHGVLFEDMFDHSEEQCKTITSEHELVHQVDKYVPEPKSPDPEIPEWDWDDNTAHKLPKLPAKTKNESSDGKESEQCLPANTTETVRSGNSRSQPISINKLSNNNGRLWAGGHESAQSYDEKRKSRSLEDGHKKANLGMDKPEQVVNLYHFHSSLSDVFSFGQVEYNDCITLLEKHYCTIHLPIKNDSRHSFSSLLYLNPAAFKEFHAHERTNPAFDGFNMVPSLKPLETLHNNLTMRDLDTFLYRTTTTKFFTPLSSPMYEATPLPSPRLSESLTKSKSLNGRSLPSSSNSSAGPSSPSSSLMSADILTKLRCYIMESAQIDQADDFQSDLYMGSSNSKKDCVQVSPNQSSKGLSMKEYCPQTQAVKSNDESSVVKETKQPSDSQPASESASPRCAQTGFQSAFKMVSRSNSQKVSMFKVSQVSEDSLNVSKTAAVESGKNGKMSVEMGNAGKSVGEPGIVESSNKK